LDSISFRNEILKSKKQNEILQEVKPLAINLSLLFLKELKANSQKLRAYLLFFSF